jgi:chromate transporter
MAPPEELQPPPPPPTPPTPTTPPTLAEAVRTWARIGLESFGGPAGQIAVMHRILVREKRWIGERRFLQALNFCMLLPGPEAMQLATYLGWLMHRTLGGIVAGTLFVLPGFLSILGLSVLYVAFGGAPAVSGLFLGLKGAVVVIIAQALVRIGGRALRGPAMASIAIGAFIAIFLLAIPFPVVILAAAAIGLVGARARPQWFALGSTAEGGASDDPSLLGDRVPEHARPERARALRTLAIWSTLWLLPTALLAATLGLDSRFTALAAFFSIAALVTFGGAYAVLAYVAEHAVERAGWLDATQMLDGLAMAETTPGPLIQVVQFVGFMAAQGAPGGLSPLAAGVLASLLVTWVTFTPCFLWIFLGGPFIESIRTRPGLQAALAAITAAVVGVIASLGAWFTIHALFAEVDALHLGPLRVLAPQWPTLDPAVLAIGALAALLLGWWRRGVLASLLCCGAAGVLWELLR